MKASLGMSTLPNRFMRTGTPENEFSGGPAGKRMKQPYLLITFEHNRESFTGDINFAKSFHTFFAFGLFSEHFFLA